MFACLVRAVGVGARPLELGTVAQARFLGCLESSACLVPHSRAIWPGAWLHTRYMHAWAGQNGREAWTGHWTPVMRSDSPNPLSLPFPQAPALVAAIPTRRGGAYLGVARGVAHRSACR
eukprot:scaffold5703_cov135-Isochrysis_galbana.AAC.4